MNRYGNSSIKSSPHRKRMEVNMLIFKYKRGIYHTAEKVTVNAGFMQLRAVFVLDKSRIIMVIGK